MNTAIETTHKSCKQTWWLQNTTTTTIAAFVYVARFAVPVGSSRSRGRTPAGCDAVWSAPLNRGFSCRAPECPVEILKRGGTWTSAGSVCRRRQPVCVCVCVCVKHVVVVTNEDSGHCCVSANFHRTSTKKATKLCHWKSNLKNRKTRRHQAIFSSFSAETMLKRR